MRRKKKLVFNFSLAFVVELSEPVLHMWIWRIFSLLYRWLVRKANDEYSHCKLLSKSTIWTSIQLCASKKGKRHLNWMPFQRTQNSYVFPAFYETFCHFHLSVYCLFRIRQHPNTPTHSLICMLLCKQQVFFPGLVKKNQYFLMVIIIVICRFKREKTCPRGLPIFSLLFWKSREWGCLLYPWILLHFLSCGVVDNI